MSDRASLQCWAGRGLLGLAAMMAGSAQAGPFESAVPSNSIVFVNFKNLQETHDRFMTSTGGQMLKDPQMKPFVDKVKTEWQNGLNKLEEKSGLPVRDFIGAVKGQVSFNVRLADDPDEDPPFMLLMVDISGAPGKAENFLQLLTNYLTNKRQMNKQMVGDVQAFSAGPPQPRKQFCFVKSGNTVVFSNDPQHCQQAAGALSGGGNSLVNNDRFSAFRQQAGGPQDVEVFVNLPEIINAVVAKNPQAGEMVSRLKLNTLQFAGMGIGVMNQNYQQIMQLIVKTNGPSPLLDLFRMPAKAMAPEPWVPSNIVGYNSMSWDFDLFYKTLSDLVNMFVPGGMAMVDQAVAGDPNNPIVNIKEDIVKPLGNRISLISDLGDSKGMPVNRTLLAWELDDANRFRQFMTKIMGLASVAVPLQQKTVGGNIVWSYNVGDLLAQQNPNADMPVGIGNVGLTVTNTHFMLSTHLEVMDKTLLQGATPLAETVEYKAVAAQFPPKNSMIAFNQPEAQAKAGWTAVKSGQFGKIIKQAMDNASDASAKEVLSAFMPLIDGSLLPPYEAVQKYMKAPAGGFGAMDDTGYHFRMFSLKP